MNAPTTLPELPEALGERPIALHFMQQPAKHGAVLRGKRYRRERLRCQHAGRHTAESPRPLGTAHRDISADQRKKLRRQYPVQHHRDLRTAQRHELGRLQSDARVSEVRPSVRSQHRHKGDTKVVREG